MSAETPLQHDMFSGEVVDARSSYRKRQDKQRQQPIQSEMFSAQETVQIGVNPRPWLKALPAPQMALESQDVRTDEEKAQDWWREAQQQITPMFAEIEATNSHPQADAPQVKTPPVETRIVFEAAPLRPIGFRAAARRASIPVRWQRNISRPAA